MDRQGSNSSIKFRHLPSFLRSILTVNPRKSCGKAFLCIPISARDFRTGANPVQGNPGAA
jgi:hypothetical protein